MLKEHSFVVAVVGFGLVVLVGECCRAEFVVAGLDSGDPIGEFDGSGGDDERGFVREWEWQYGAV